MSSFVSFQVKYLMRSILVSDLVQFGFQRKDANPAVDFHFKHRKSMVLVFFLVARQVYLLFQMPFYTASLLGASQSCLVAQYCFN